MIIRRVELLHSIADEGYHERVRQIRNNPLLDDISFEHFCVIDPSRSLSEGGLLAAHDAMAGIVDWNIAGLLAVKMTYFQPDVLIVHAGCAFVAAPSDCLTMLRSLKRIFPTLPLALERKSEWASRLDVLVPHLHLFVDDEMVDKIIDAVF